MFRRNWIGLFPNNQSSDLSNELERGYEAALLIQSLELEFYNDRPIRPDLELVRTQVGSGDDSQAFPHSVEHLSLHL